MRVIKRDGTVQDWDFSKIEGAIYKAFLSVIQEDESSLEEIRKFLEYVRPVFEKLISNTEEINVEEIHNVIQKELIKKNKYELSRGIDRGTGNDRSSITVYHHQKINWRGLY